MNKLNFDAVNSHVSILVLTSHSVTFPQSVHTIVGFNKDRIIQQSANCGIRYIHATCKFSRRTSVCMVPGVLKERLKNYL